MVKQAESGIDLEMIREAVAAYVAKEITPFAAQWDREASFPAQALKGLAELGCFGIAVPDHLGGPQLSGSCGHPGRNCSRRWCNLDHHFGE